MVKKNLSDKTITFGTFVLYAVMGLAALVLCSLFFKSALPEYRTKQYYDATITDIYYTDSEGMVSEEYIEFLEQHVMVSYQDGDELKTERLYHQNENWEIGESIQVYWDNGQLKDKAVIWEKPMLALYVGILFVLAGFSYLKDWIRKRRETEP